MALTEMDFTSGGSGNVLSLSNVTVGNTGQDYNSYKIPCNFLPTTIFFTATVNNTAAKRFFCIDNNTEPNKMYQIVNNQLVSMTLGETTMYGIKAITSSYIELVNYNNQNHVYSIEDLVAH